MRHFPNENSQYQLLDTIGDGASSTVYSALCLTNGDELAIKLVDLDECPVDMDRLRQEVAFWSSSTHPNIVSYLGSFLSGQYLHILMELMSAGSIYDIMRFQYPNGFADEIVIATILKSITLALSYLHANAQIHRDIKPGNALVSADGAIKLGDFGVAATLVEEGQRRRARYTRIGTPCYMAPEVLQDEKGHTEKADIWSLGITAIELATGSAPYATLKELDIVQKILKAPPPQLPKTQNFSAEYRDFVKKCMIFDPRKRPSASDLLEHLFIRKAAGQEYIVANLLSGLPPLQNRREALKRLNLWEQESGKKPQAASCPTPVQWSFLNEFETSRQEKKGRFTIRRSPSSAEGSDDSRSGGGKKKEEADAGKSARIERLEGMVRQLETEQAAMKGQIDILTALVMKVAGQTA
jgi:serine/threonine-protein kinase OSR1/STK39